MFPSNIFSLGGEKSSTSVQATQTEEKIRRLLTDEDIQVISSFELNQIATLTFHESSNSVGEDLCELVFEVLQSVLSKPLQYTPLAMQKALVVTQHVLIFGADAVINESKVLGRHVEALLNYNTVLLAQQQQNATGMFMRIKGGGVDKGHPVRERAQAVNLLLSDVNRLKFERNSRADPNSLVPVGSDKAAFVSDDVRLHALKKKMEQQQMIEIKSNLAKADNGFGSGYNAKDGKSVVGAAHGLDEMMKLAKAKERREKSKFSDDPQQQPQQQTSALSSEPFSSYVAPSMNYGQQMQATTNNNAGDLLSMDDAHVAPAEVDLLDFGGGGTTEPSTTAASAASYSHDLLGVATAMGAPAPASGTDLLGTTANASSNAPDVYSAGDLLGNVSINDASARSAPQQPQNDILGTSSQRDGQSVSPPPQPPTDSQQQQQHQQKISVMGGSAGSGDPFSAFDALSATSGAGGSQIITSCQTSTGTDGSSSAMAAQDRILGGFASNSLSSNANTPAVNINNINQGTQKDDGISPYSSASMGRGLQVSSPAMTMPMAQQQEQAPYQAPTSTSLNVSDSQVPPSWGGSGSADDEGDENGFACMGGTVGAGLEPLGEAPAAPPPPPPPPPTFY